MIIKKLPQIGNSILRRKAKPVNNFQDKKVKQTIKDLVETMRDSSLIGMAAPQLGRSLRIFATEIRKTKYRNPSELSKLTIYINPRIVKSSKETSVDYEGCGSVVHTQLFAPVKRPKIVTIEAYDKNSKKFQVKASELLGRVIQHEYDHLEGILFTDKIFDWKKILSSEEYKKYKDKKIKAKRRSVNKSAKKIWDYHHVNHALKKSDCILVMGSHDTRVAEKGAELFLEGWAPLIIFSGGLGTLTKNKWKKSEAEIFSKIAVKIGVPQDKMLIENQSTNTGENVLFTKRLLEKKGICPKRVIIVQKPYMERRAYATFKKVWPGIKVVVTSPQIPFKEYPNKEIRRDDVINIIVGDLQRIKIYPERGFQIYQEIPPDVWKAYQRLVKAGHTKHLIFNNSLKSKG